MPTCWRCEESYSWLLLSEHQCYGYSDEIDEAGVGSNTDYAIGQEEDRAVSDQNYADQEVTQPTDQDVSALPRSSRVGSPTGKRVPLFCNVRERSRGIRTPEPGYCSGTETSGGIKKTPGGARSVTKIFKSP